MGAIYSILNKSNGKIYIGLTSDPSDRFSRHKYKLNMGKHFNPHLQNAWNKYGENSFEFNIIEHCDDEELGENERWWIDHLDSTNRDIGYNIRTGGDSNFKHSEETKLKISESLKHSNPMHNKSIAEKFAMDKSIKDNKTGYFRVIKTPKNDCKQGFYWRYQWREDGKRYCLSSVNFEKLKGKVLEKGLPWGRISEFGVSANE